MRGYLQAFGAEGGSGMGERSIAGAASGRVAAGLGAAARRLCRDIAPLRFGAPVTHVYNPLEYARKPHQAYLRRYGASRKRVLYLGMNPGPFGMAQTGVPFGNVADVRDWLGIQGPISKPPREHPRRPVLGFECPRSEVSGARLWGAIARNFDRPEQFFSEHFVANYCPLAFLESSGRNVTPDKLRAAEREPLFQACDRHLRRMADLLEPEWVVGIGAFAEARAAEALGDRVRIGRILHPSPANPRAQRDWEGAAKRELAEIGVCDVRRRRSG
jgi:single-strand selective monofunctional uracil DNA glycosylase